MNNVWVLVCDAAKARVFEIRQGDPTWHAVELVLHEGSRSKASELVGGRSGSRSSEGRSVHHNALAPASSPKEVEKESFAHTLTTTLDQGMRSARFRKWVLVAPPHFLGLMRKEITSELEKHLLTMVDKDFNDLAVHELSERLRDAVRVPVSDQESIRGDRKRPH